MGILKFERRILNKMIEKSFYYGLVIGELRNILSTKELWAAIELSNNEETEIRQVFVQNYGKNYSSKWHRLYQSFTGQFDKYYFPEILFSTKLEPMLNNRNICYTLQDKNMLEILYNSVEELYLPKTIIGNSNGILFCEGEKGRQIISFEDACKIVSAFSKVLIKPTVASSSGREVNIYDFHEGADLCSRRDIKDVLKTYGINFIVQEHVDNCSEIKQLYSDSLNTIRVITYILDGNLYNCPLTLRMGCNGNKVDNIHAGGIAVGMTPDGYLKKYAFNQYGGKYLRHPDSNVLFDGYYIPNIPKILEIAYRCHMKTPQISIISWDFSLDKNSNVILIESNMYGQTLGGPQMVNGESAFGINTPRMLQLISQNNRSPLLQHNSIRITKEQHTNEVLLDDTKFYSHI